MVDRVVPQAARNFFSRAASALGSIAQLPSAVSGGISSAYGTVDRFVGISTAYGTVKKKLWYAPTEQLTAAATALSELRPILDRIINAFQRLTAAGAAPSPELLLEMSTNRADLLRVGTAAGQTLDALLDHIDANPTKYGFAVYGFSAEDRRILEEFLDALGSQPMGTDMTRESLLAFQRAFNPAYELVNSWTEGRGKWMLRKAKNVGDKFLYVAPTHRPLLENCRKYVKCLGRNIASANYVYNAEATHLLIREALTSINALLDACAPGYAVAGFDTTQLHEVLQLKSELSQLVLTEPRMLGPAIRRAPTLGPTLAKAEKFLTSWARGGGLQWVASPLVGTNDSDLQAALKLITELQKAAAGRIPAIVRDLPAALNKILLLNNADPDWIKLSRDAVRRLTKIRDLFTGLGQPLSPADLLRAKDYALVAQACITGKGLDKKDARGWWYSSHPEIVELAEAIESLNAIRINRETSEDELRRSAEAAVTAIRQCVRWSRETQKALTSNERYELEDLQEELTAVLTHDGRLDELRGNTPPGHRPPEIEHMLVQVQQVLNLWKKSSITKSQAKLPANTGALQPMRRALDSTRALLTISSNPVADPLQFARDLEAARANLDTYHRAVVLYTPRDESAAARREREQLAQQLETARNLARAMPATHAARTSLVAALRELDATLTRRTETLAQAAPATPAAIPAPAALVSADALNFSTAIDAGSCPEEFRAFVLKLRSLQDAIQRGTAEKILDAVRFSWAQLTAILDLAAFPDRQAVATRYKLPLPFVQHLYLLRDHLKHALDMRATGSCDPTNRENFHFSIQGSSRALMPAATHTSLAIEALERTLPPLLTWITMDDDTRSSESRALTPIVSKRLQQSTWELYIGSYNQPGELTAYCQRQVGELRALQASPGQATAEILTAASKALQVVSRPDPQPMEAAKALASLEFRRLEDQRQKAIARIPLSSSLGYGAAAANWLLEKAPLRNGPLKQWSQNAIRNLFIETEQLEIPGKVACPPEFRFIEKELGGLEMAIRSGNPAQILDAVRRSRSFLRAVIETAGSNPKQIAEKYEIPANVNLIDQLTLLLADLEQAMATDGGCDPRSPNYWFVTAERAQRKRTPALLMNVRDRIDSWKTAADKYDVVLKGLNVACGVEESGSVHTQILERHFHYYLTSLGADAPAFYRNKAAALAQSLLEARANPASLTNPLNTARARAQEHLSAQVPADPGPANDYLVQAARLLAAVESLTPPEMDSQGGLLGSLIQWGTNRLLGDLPADAPVAVVVRNAGQAIQHTVQTVGQQLHDMAVDPNATPLPLPRAAPADNPLAHPPVFAPALRELQRELTSLAATSERADATEAQILETTRRSYALLTGILATGGNPDRAAVANTYSIAPQTVNHLYELQDTLGQTLANSAHGSCNPRDADHYQFTRGAGGPSLALQRLETVQTAFAVLSTAADATVGILPSALRGAVGARTASLPENLLRSRMHFYLLCLGAGERAFYEARQARVRSLLAATTQPQIREALDRVNQCLTALPAANTPIGDDYRHRIADALGSLEFHVSQHAPTATHGLAGIGADMVRDFIVSYLGLRDGAERFVDGQATSVKDAFQKWLTDLVQGPSAPLPADVATAIRNLATVPALTVGPRGAPGAIGSLVNGIFDFSESSYMASIQGVLQSAKEFYEGVKRDGLLSIPQKATKATAQYLGEKLATYINENESVMDAATREKLEKVLASLEEGAENGTISSLGEAVDNALAYFGVPPIISIREVLQQTKEFYALIKEKGVRAIPTVTIQKTSEFFGEKLARYMDTLGEDDEDTKEELEKVRAALEKAADTGSFGQAAEAASEALEYISGRGLEAVGILSKQSRASREDFSDTLDRIEQARNFNVGKDDHRPIQEMIDEESADFIKNTAHFGPLKFLYEKFCGCPTEDHKAPPLSFYVEMMSEAAAAGRGATEEARLKELFMAQLEKDGVSPVTRFFVRIFYPLCMWLTKTLLPRAFQGSLDWADEFIENNNNDTTTRYDNRIVDRTLGYLATLHSAFDQVGASNKITDNIDEEVSKALDSPEANEGLARKADPSTSWLWRKPGLYDKVSKKLIDNYVLPPPRLMWSLEPKKMSPLTWDLQFHQWMTKKKDKDKKDYTDEPRFSNGFGQALATGISWVIGYLILWPIQNLVHVILSRLVKHLFPGESIDALLDQTISSLEVNGYSHALNCTIFDQLQEVLKLIKKQDGEVEASDDEDDKIELMPISDAERKKLRALVTELFDVFPKTDCLSPTELKALLQKQKADKSWLEKGNDQVEKYIYSQAKESVIDLLRLGFQTLLKKGQMKLLLYKFMTIANSIYKRETPITLEEYRAKEEGVKALLDEITKRAIDKSVDESFDYDRTRENRAVEKLTAEMHKISDGALEKFKGQLEDLERLREEEDDEDPKITEQLSGMLDVQRDALQKLEKLRGDIKNSKELPNSQTKLLKMCDKLNVKLAGVVDSLIQLQQPRVKYSFGRDIAPSVQALESGFDDLDQIFQRATLDLEGLKESLEHTRRLGQLVTTLRGQAAVNRPCAQLQTALTKTSDKAALAKEKIEGIQLLREHLKDHDDDTTFSQWYKGLGQSMTKSQLAAHSAGYKKLQGYIKDLPCEEEEQSKLTQIIRSLSGAKTDAQREEKLGEWQAAIRAVEEGLHKGVEVSQKAVQKALRASKKALEGMTELTVYKSPDVSFSDLEREAEDLRKWIEDDQGLDSFTLPPSRFPGKKLIAGISKRAVKDKIKVKVDGAVTFMGKKYNWRYGIFHRNFFLPFLNANPDAAPAKPKKKAAAVEEADEVAAAE